MAWDLAFALCVAWAGGCTGGVMLHHEVRGAGWKKVPLLAVQLAISLSEGDELLGARLCSSRDALAMASAGGLLLFVPLW